MGKETQPSCSQGNSPRRSGTRQVLPSSRASPRCIGPLAPSIQASRCIEWRHIPPRTRPARSNHLYHILHGLFDRTTKWAVARHRAESSALFPPPYLIDTEWSPSCCPAGLDIPARTRSEYSPSISISIQGNPEDPCSL